ncbi:tyrosine-protein kinase ptk [bacterium BMS3Abin05]|nr:tyrosine-protein kinase ptk [bacterium BMS3Abin05]GBE28693.1 tyrosine-protein kinase ptk [bacterium BMS3Bbin03]
MTLSFVDVFHVLTKWRKFIFYNFLIFSIVAAIISFILPKWYTSTAVLFPPQKTQSLGAGFMSMLTELPINLPSLPGMVTPADVYLAILRSRNVNESVIRKLDLKKRFGTETDVGTLEILRNRTFFDKTEEDLLVIKATDKSPVFAQKIADAFLQELDRVNRQKRVTSAHYSRVFLGERLKEVNRDLKNAAIKLRDFQERTKAISIKEQTKAEIDMAANLQAEIAMQEIKLNVLSRILEPSHPDVVQARNRLNEMKKQLKKIEVGLSLSTDSYIIPFDKIPNLSMQYMFLLKDVEVQKAILKVLTQQYEQAKIEEKSNTPILQVLDKPDIPEKKSKPQRRLIVMLSALLSFFASGIYIYFREYQLRLKKNNPEAFRKLESSISSLKPINFFRH